MMTAMFRTLPLAPLALALTLSLTACDNPVATDEEHEDHLAGLALVNDQGATVTSYTAGGGAVGHLGLTVGGAQTYRVVGVGEDGDLLEIDGEEFAVSLDTAPSVLTATLQGVDQLVVTGVAAGTGNLTLGLAHEGHEELVADFPVVVQ